ncbi:MFS transporter [Nocardioides marmorisolisilvae]|uniref:MFS transporter n=1 Tax=Nocardioides marmorisolisilvae TaxID=1542737 RepID=UPI001FE3D6FF|nr:MFS transporter [Nocardioides marmorisolisilvae]
MTSGEVSDPPELHRTRLAVAAAFATQGGVFISLTTRLPDFQDKYDLSNGELSGLLLMMVLLAGGGSVLAETRAKALSSARLLRTGLVGLTVGAALIGASQSLSFFIAAMATYGLSLGMVDATTNMQAVALEHRYGRPILPSFHSAWTFGGLIGAALALATSHLDVGWVGLVAVVPLAVQFAPFLAGIGDPAQESPAPVIPWRPIILVGIGMVLFYMVDTAAFTWGPLFLKNVFDDTPSGLFALAVFPYLLSSGAMRFAGDGLVARYGAVPILRIGAVVASASLAVVVFAPAWPIAVLGFLVLGSGVGVIAPLSFSAAARIAGGEEEDPATRQRRVDAVIGRFNQFNYVGALIGSVLTGAVGEHDLRVGFAVPMVLILGILPLARAFAPGEVSLGKT